MYYSRYECIKDPARRKECAWYVLNNSVMVDISNSVVLRHKH